MAHTEKMRGRAPTGWSFTNLESLADWAEELRVIQSSMVTRYCQTLAQCQERLTYLARKVPVAEAEAPLPRKSIRVRKTLPDAPGASVSTSARTKAGEIYINAVKVSVVLFL